MRLSWKSSGLIHAKCLEQCLVHSKCSLNGSYLHGYILGYSAHCTMLSFIQSVLMSSLCPLTGSNPALLSFYPHLSPFLFFSVTILSPLLFSIFYPLPSLPSHFLAFVCAQHTHTHPYTSSSSQMFTAAALFQQTFLPPSQSDKSHLQVNLKFRRCSVSSQSRKLKKRNPCNFNW